MNASGGYAGRHAVHMSRRQVVIALLLAGLLSVGTGLVGWAVGRTAEAIVGVATDDGPIAVDTRYDLDTDVLLAGQQSPAVISAAMNEGYPTFQQYVATSHGVYTQGLGIALITYGKKLSPLIIRGIYAVNVTCSAPKEPWTLLKTSHGGPFPPLPLAIGLHDGVAKEPGVPDKSWSFPRQVSVTDADYFFVQPTAPTGQICSFSLEIEYTFEGRDGVKRIDSNGTAFKVADASAASRTINMTA